MAGGADVEAQVEAQVVILTNQARADAGCAALRVDPRIASAAQAHSDDMAKRNYFEHDSLDGRTFADRLRAAGYPRPGAENIAFGQRSASEVMAAWLDSPGHRRNILDCDLVAIGVGYNPDGTYWTQDFGR
ncbi:MAG: CAP domain-containing protein [Pseudonocardia sp.]|nr:CAP domain-containing protein [Pseudonocardia sp.]